MASDDSKRKPPTIGDRDRGPWMRGLKPVAAEDAAGHKADAEESPPDGAVPAVLPERDPFDDLVGSGGSEAAFTEDDADSRRGHFIVPFGLPGSGKTTFLASLFKFIDESENLTSQIVVPRRGEGRNYAGQAMLNQWQKVFNQGRFLGATPVGGDAIRELTYEVTPLKGQRARLNFSVVEVSGEDLGRVVAREGSVPRLPDAIAALFRNVRIRVMIVLVVHPNQLENDLLFNNLFIWLNTHARDRMKTFSLAVLIANPDLALRRLHKRRPDLQGYDTLAGKVLKTYLKEFAPKTHSLYSSWPKRRRAILAFRVGKIETRQEDGKTHERIVQFKKTNAAQFFAWMYQQFTGRKLGLGPLRRLFRWLNG